MVVAPDLVDLFVVGADFYAGSTKKSLENGWCNFATLGLEQARLRFGTRWGLGTVWYTAERVLPSTLRGFEEYARQDMWLRAQGARVARIIVGSAQQTKRPGALVAGREYSFRTESEAVSALQTSGLAPAAMVIAVDDEYGSLLTFVNDRYDHQQKILLPPDSDVCGISGAYRLEPDDLKAARLTGSESDELWKSYKRSRNDKAVVAKWLSDISDSEVRKWLYQLLRGRLPRNPKDWLTRVHVEPGTVARVIKEIEPYLKSIGAVNNRLARDRRCSEFIGKNLIKDVASEIAEQEAATLPQSYNSADPGFKVIIHDRFFAELGRLPYQVRNELQACIELLKRRGPQLDRPRVGQLGGSRYPKMMELRFNAVGGVWRVAFAFDANRQAVLLVADDKSGWPNQESFYRQLIRKADERYAAHLAIIKRPK